MSDTVRLPAARYTLGWRFQLDVDAQRGVDAFLPRGEYAKGFSPARTVWLESFEIQTQPLDLESLLASVPDARLDDVSDLPSLCDLVDSLLSPWRVPTEDELEAALGGGLFVWGDELPAGTPHRPGDFDLHLRPAASGLVVKQDTYTVELTRAALKMGDGGCALCGDYPWPVAWLTLSQSARIPDEMLADELFAWLEGAKIHPARASQT